MRKYKTYTKPVELLESVVCDKCGYEYDDEMDIKEFCSIEDTGGYSSSWGDGCHWSVDLCSSCSVDMFEDIATLHNVDMGVENGS